MPRRLRQSLTERAKRLRSLLRGRPGGGIGPKVRRPPTGRPSLMRGAARSLLVTPWFAAGAGFVLAAGLWIYSPHTELRFPTTMPESVPCAPGCSISGGHSAGSLAAKGPVLRIKNPQHAERHTGQSNVTGQPNAASGLTFKFTVLWQRDNRFVAQIAVSGSSVPSSWHLKFAMPGDEIGYVMGAQWQPTPGDDGGTASAYQGYQQGGNRGDGRHGFSFSVTGSGSASTPADCAFDGASCTFG